VPESIVRVSKQRPTSACITVRPSMTSNVDSSYLQLLEEQRQTSSARADVEEESNAYSRTKSTYAAACGGP